MDQKEDNKSGRYFYLPLLILLVGLAFFTGFGMGNVSGESGANVVGVVNQDLHKAEGVDFEPFWRAWRILDEHFVSSTTTEPVTDQDKVWGAIQGLAAVYDDPYTVFLPPRENEIFESEIRGQFEGVGMEIGIRDGILTVIAPLKGTPADKAGIKSGDQIVEIDGGSTAGMTVEDAVSRIRGKRGTKVSLTINRSGMDELIKIEVTRDRINIPTIETEILKDEKIFVIRLFSFSESSTTLFRGALRDFVKAIRAGEADKLIFDLRGNPGGFLEASVDISSWFLPAGVPVVSESFRGKQEDIVHRSKGYDIFKNLKVVVLIDGGSASASEIVAGALRDHGVATLVGSQTFGKGSVQRLFSITEDTALKVTIAQWLTPSGVSISDGGLVPDAKVEFTEKDKEAGRDPAMEKAIEILTN